MMFVVREERNGRKKTSTDESTRKIDAVSARAVGEKAVVSDANQPRRKDVQQKAAEELVDVQSEGLLGVAMRVVAIAEADAFSVEPDDPGVTDGNAMGVVGEISENLFRATEGRFAVDDPVGSASPCEEQVEGDRVSDNSFGELEPSLTPSFAQGVGQ